MNLVVLNGCWGCSGVKCMVYSKANELRLQIVTESTVQESLLRV